MAQGGTWSRRVRCRIGFETRAKPSIEDPTDAFLEERPRNSAGAATDLRNREHVCEPQPDEADVALLGTKRIPSVGPRILSAW